MNFNFKFSNYQNLYIFFLLFALIKIFFSTGNLYAKGFNINNVEISTKFEINFNRDYVLDEGFDLSFNKLIQTILKSEDQKKINNTSLNEIKSMIETFSIKEEKFVNQIYYLNLDVTFNKKQIFEFLEKKNVFPSLQIKNKIFLLSIIIDESKNEILVFSDNFIFKNINENIQSNELLEYVLPSEDLEDLKSIKDNIKNIENYDLNEFIDNVTKSLNQTQLGSGNYYEITGEAQENAKSREDLIAHSVIAIAGVLLMLFIAFGTLRNLSLTLLNLPFALIGGVIAASMHGGWISIGSLVGFVTLFGITLRNSIMLISHYQHLVDHEGHSWNLETCIQGASERLPSILMTALVAGLALLPIAIGSGEPGKEIEGPMAMIIIGGLFTSTILNLLILPTVLLHYGEFKRTKFLNF